MASPNFIITLPVFFFHLSAQYPGSGHERGLFTASDPHFTKNEGVRPFTQRTFVVYIKKKQMKTISIIIVAMGIICVFYQQYVEMKAKKTNH